MMLKIQLSMSQATSLGNGAFNWCGESCERISKFECEKYFNAIVRDSVKCVRQGVMCYLFTEEQIEVLRVEMLTVKTNKTFLVRELDDRFLIIPRTKRGMKK
jgi:hypothetical protein